MFAYVLCFLFRIYVLHIMWTNLWAELQKLGFQNLKLDCINFELKKIIACTHRSLNVRVEWQVGHQLVVQLKEYTCLLP